MDTLLIRMGALLLHVFINIVIVSYILRFDVSGSWLAMGAFVISLFILLALLILHVMGFIKYLKTKAR